jgi:hypothetical protein
MNCEVQENGGLNAADAANHEFPKAWYIRAISRGPYVDAGLFPPCGTL